MWVGDRVKTHIETVFEADTIIYQADYESLNGLFIYVSMYCAPAERLKRLVLEASVGVQWQERKNATSKVAI